MICISKIQHIQPVCTKSITTVGRHNEQLLLQSYSIGTTYDAERDLLAIAKFIVHLSLRDMTFYIFSICGAGLLSLGPSL